jgi:hypothetical protein
MIEWAALRVWQTQHDSRWCWMLPWLVCLPFCTQKTKSKALFIRSESESEQTILLVCLPFCTQKTTSKALFIHGLSLSLGRLSLRHFCGCIFLSVENKTKSVVYSLSESESEQTFGGRTYACTFTWTYVYVKTKRFRERMQNACICAKLYVCT